MVSSLGVVGSSAGLCDMKRGLCISEQIRGVSLFRSFGSRGQEVGVSSTLGCFAVGG